MTTQTPVLKSSPFAIDWSNVRAVYKKLQTDFHMLTEPFGIFIPEPRNIDLSHLICAIDVVDRHLDDLEDADTRERFMDQTLGFLRDGSSCLPKDVSEEFIGRMECLKELIHRLGIQDEFCDTVKTIVDHGEAKRTAQDHETMIHHLIEEWRLTGVLPVLVMRELSNPAFESFFYHCCATMPAIDMLQDARADYRCGQIQVRPTIWLHCKLLWVFLSGLPKLLFKFPKRFTLFRYAVSFIWEGITRGAIGAQSALPS